MPHHPKRRLTAAARQGEHLLWAQALIGMVGNHPETRIGKAELVADLGYRGAFHLDAERLWRHLANAISRGRISDDLIAGGDRAAVQRWRVTAGLSFCGSPTPVGRLQAS